MEEEEYLFAENEMNQEQQDQSSTKDDAQNNQDDVFAYKSTNND